MPPILSEDERARLREYLVATLVAGPTKTPRSNAVRNAELLAAGDPDKMLGFSYDGLEAARGHGRGRGAVRLLRRPDRTRRPRLHRSRPDPRRARSDGRPARRGGAAGGAGPALHRSPDRAAAPVHGGFPGARPRPAARCSPRPRGSSSAHDHRGRRLRVFYLDGVGVLFRRRGSAAHPLRGTDGDPARSERAARISSWPTTASPARPSSVASR